MKGYLPVWSAGNVVYTDERNVPVSFKTRQQAEEQLKEDSLSEEAIEIIEVEVKLHQ